jgi:PAS domain S-box-containing protein
MKDNIFNYRIKVVEQHLETLWQYTNEWPAPQKEFLDKVLEDLSNTLEELKLAQEELRQQNEELATAQGTVEAERQRYRDLFEFAPDGYLVTDIKGVIHETNRAAATLLNVSQNLLVNTPVFVFVVEADRKGFRTELLRLAELKQVQTWEIQLMRHESTPFHAAITVAPVYDSGSELVSLRWLLRDITERKRIEGELRKAHNELGIRIQERTAELAKANEALRTEFIERKLVEGALGESEEQHRNLFENVPTGIYRITPDGHILMANPALIRMLGYSSFEELTSRTLENDERFGPAYPQSQFKELEGEVRGLESAWVRRDGTMIFVRENARAIRGEDGAVLYYEGTVEDITERERVEEALRESEERYRTLVEHTYDLITETNIDGRYLYASPKHKDVLGYEPSELMDRNVFEHVHPDDRLAVIGEFQRAIKTLSSGHVVYRYRHKNGQWLWLESTGKPYQTATGEIRGVITSRDITDRKRAEEVLRENFAQLSKKNRYETIISTVTRSVHQSINLQDVFENAVDAMSKNIDRVDNVGIFLAEGEEAVMKANRGYPDWFIERVRRIPCPRGFTWKTIIEGKPLYCANADKDTVIGPAGREVGTKSYVSMPIHFETKTVGAICINSFQKNAFDEEELNLLEIIAQQIEIAISNAQQAEALRESEERYRKAKDELEIKVEERTAELRKTNEQLLAEIAERKRAEEELKNSREQLRALAARLQSVREEERRQIAREVHDELGQALTGLKMDLSWLISKLSEAGVKARRHSIADKIQSISNLINTTIKTVRRIATELRPDVLDDLGLVAAIEWQVHDFQKRTGIKCEFTPGVEDIGLDQDRSTAVFRIFQETLTNIARHANATRVNTRLRKDTGNIMLEVEDNGRGITEEEISNSKSLGLLGMRERAFLLGGEVNITGRREKGTTVTVRIPLGN